MKVFFDLDSTLVNIEGLDEMARWKGIWEEISEITRKTMSGEMDFTKTLPAKIDAISPSISDIYKLSELYIAEKVKGLDELFSEFRKQNIEYGIITGNLNPAPKKFAEHLNIKPEFVFANEVRHNDEGNYHSFDDSQDLAKDEGKMLTVKKLKEQFPNEEIIYVGDSTSDMKTESVADMFIGFGGVVERPKVKENAKYYVWEILDVLKII